MTMNNEEIRLPAEWEPQDAIMLLWPHESTDWNYMLDDAQNCFTEIASAINNEHERLVIVAPDTGKVRKQLQFLDQSTIKFIDTNTNDTWARDVCPITTLKGKTPVINDFKFNGWGLKYAANFDNLVTSELKKSGLFDGCYYNNQLSFVIEGGSIESDGNGTLLTTSKCLLSPNRNGGYDKDKISSMLKRMLGTQQILWLDYGYLEGDDTDSHIDTLARFAPDDNIVFTSTENKSDTHYDELQKMKEQLHGFRSASHKPYKLTELPLPDPIFDKEGKRLPATYANFLIGNKFVLVPTYNQPDNDKAAIETIQNIFGDYKIIGINCIPLIQQHGSLHCVTMQFPKGSIKF